MNRGLCTRSPNLHVTPARSCLLSNCLRVYEVIYFEAGDLASHDVFKWWALCLAACRGMGAAGRKHATFGRVERRGQLALEHNAFALGAMPRQPWCRGQQ